MEVPPVVFVTDSAVCLRSDIYCEFMSEINSFIILVCMPFSIASTTTVRFFVVSCSSVTMVDSFFGFWSHLASSDRIVVVAVFSGIFAFEKTFGCLYPANELSFNAFIAATRADTDSGSSESMIV